MDAAYIGCADPHQSESAAEHKCAMQSLSVFTGTVMYCEATLEHAAFWSDHFYAAQMERELNRLNHCH